MNVLLLNKNILNFEKTNGHLPQGNDDYDCKDDFVKKKSFTSTIDSKMVNLDKLGTMNSSNEQSNNSECNVLGVQTTLHSIESTNEVTNKKQHLLNTHVSPLSFSSSTSSNRSTPSPSSSSNQQNSTNHLQSQNQYCTKEQNQTHSQLLISADLNVAHNNSRPASQNSIVSSQFSLNENDLNSKHLYDSNLVLEVNESSNTSQVDCEEDVLLNDDQQNEIKHTNSVMSSCLLDEHNGSASEDISSVPQSPQSVHSYENQQHQQKLSHQNQHQNQKIVKNLYQPVTKTKYFYTLDTRCSALENNQILEQVCLMYNEQQLLDCTLVCEDQCIKAHKLLLAAVSPYFRSIFCSFNNNGCSNTAVILRDIPQRDMQLIIEILYVIGLPKRHLKFQLSQQRASSLRKSVNKLKINCLNDLLDECEFPELEDDNLNVEFNSDDEVVSCANRTIVNSCRKRVHPSDWSTNNARLLNCSKKNKRHLLHVNSENSLNSLDEASSLGSTINGDLNTSQPVASNGHMKHHKYKHRYLLMNEQHLTVSDPSLNQMVACANNEPLVPIKLQNSSLNEYSDDHDENENLNCSNNLEISDNNIEDEDVDSEKDRNTNKRFKCTNQDLNYSSKTSQPSNSNKEQLNKIKTNTSQPFESKDNKVFKTETIQGENSSDEEINELHDDEKVIDFSISKSTNKNVINSSYTSSVTDSNDVLKLVSDAMKNVVTGETTAEQITNLYNALKQEGKKFWNNDLNNNLNNGQQSQSNNINSNFLNGKLLANDLINSSLSQFCMSGSNLNSETARAFLFGNNGLIKNTSSQLNSIQENGLYMSSNNTPVSNALTSSANAAAALVAAAQQQILNAGIQKLSKANQLNNSTNVNNNSNNLTSNSRLSNGTNNSLNNNNQSSMQKSSSSSISVNSVLPVKRGRGRPPRHTQKEFNGFDSSDLLLQKQQSTKTNVLQTNNSTSCNNKSQSSSNNSLNSSMNNSFNSVSLNNAAAAAAAFSSKKWRPNIETLLALKSRKNKLNSSETRINSEESHNQQNSPLNQNLNTSNKPLVESSCSSNSSLNIHNNQQSSSTLSNNSNTSATDGKNMCPYCPQVYYSNQAMNDHINNVHTKNTIKHICEVCGKRFGWKISLTKHLKTVHNTLDTFSNRINLNVAGLAGITGAMGNHLNSSVNLSSVNQDLL